MKPGILIESFKDDPFYSKNNFEIVRKGDKRVLIGEGAFAEVYLIKHKQDGKYYALKQMDKSKLLSGGINGDMIYREILIQRRLIILILFGYILLKRMIRIIILYLNMLLEELYLVK